MLVGTRLPCTQKLRVRFPYSPPILETKMQIINTAFVPHAILDQWKIVDIDRGVQYATGVIYNDTKGRFRNGEWVRTSFITMQLGDHLQTRNTQYLLGNPAEAGPGDITHLMSKFKNYTLR